MLPPLPSDFAATRDAMHALAEHVLAPVRYRATGRIGLRVTPGGVGTPWFGEPERTRERVRIEGVTLVHEGHNRVRRAEITTLGAAAAFLGIPVGAPDDVYAPVTAPDVDAPLAIDPGAAALLWSWFAWADVALARLRQRWADAAPSEAQLWPEHFDLATELGADDAGTRANYGASPGDDAITEPYLYVGPWDASRRTGAFARAAFGALSTYSELAGANDPATAATDFLIARATDLLGDRG